MIITEQKTLKIEGMTMDCPDVLTSFSEEGALIVRQGSDSVWLDPEGAKALGMFLAEWGAPK